MKKEKRMQNKKVHFFMVFILVFFASTAWAQLKDGLWEMTTRVEIKGMPQQMPPSTFRQCISQKDPVPQNQDKSMACKTTQQKISGNKVTYAVECKGDSGTMVTLGENTYTGSSMDGTATTRFTMKGQPEMQMQSTIKGKYIGPCPK